MFEVSSSLPSCSADGDYDEGDDGKPTLRTSRI